MDDFEASYLAISVGIWKSSDGNDKILAKAVHSMMIKTFFFLTFWIEDLNQQFKTI